MRRVRALLNVIDYDVNIARELCDYPGFDYTNIIAYRSVCKCCTAGFLLSVSGRRVEASLRYTVSLVGICLILRPTTADNFDRSFVTSDLGFVVAPLCRGGGEAENSWTRNYPTQGLPVSTTSVCLRFSVFLQSRPTIRCVRPSIILSIYPRRTLCVCASVCYRSSSCSIRFSLQPTANDVDFEKSLPFKVYGEKDNSCM